MPSSNNDSAAIPALSSAEIVTVFVPRIHPPARSEPVADLMTGSTTSWIRKVTSRSEIVDQPSIQFVVHPGAH